MKLCGICKTLYPEIEIKTDEICLECQMYANDISEAALGV